MKKIFFLLLALVSPFVLVGASNLSVKTNLPSGEYDFPIEINMISNQKDAKIFYYTDGEGRMDHIKEFQGPFVIKEDTTVDYYATNKEYEDTLIQTSVYQFHYSDKIILKNKDNTLVIENISGKIQNIGYWTVEADNLSYEVTPNTFLENKESLGIDYNMSPGEKVTLYSPDKKTTFHFTYNPKPKTEKKVESLKNDNQELLSQNTHITIKEEEIIGSGSESTGTEIENNTKDTNLPPERVFTGSDEKNLENGLTTNIKASTIDTKNKSDNLFVIFSILLVVFLYNVGLFLKKSQTYTDLKNKFTKK